jgi:hypothetical protein
VIRVVLSRSQPLLAPVARIGEVLLPSVERTAQRQQLVGACAQHPEDDNTILGTQLEDLEARIDSKNEPHRDFGVPFLLEQTR